MNRRLTYLAVLSLSVVGIVTLLAHGNARAAETPSANSTPAASPAALLDFPEGTATRSDQCSTCHQIIYKEFTEGSGSGLRWGGMKLLSLKDKTLSFPKDSSPLPTAHAVAGTDPWPIEAAKVEEEGKKCNVCHYPQAMEYPDMAAAKIAPPKPRVAHQERGITCASCHLTPDGKIRGPYAVNAPHATVKDERMTTSIACAFCHSAGERIVGKQTQTFLEWREDFSKPGLGPQQCQDCHMPKTIRKLAEIFDVPERVVARHLWTGGHSFQRTASALTLAIVQTEVGMPQMAFHVTNIAAGHSVPTGSNRRGIYLIAEVVNSNGKVVASKEWMFAPWFGDRPDDKAFVEEDKKGPEPVAATQADAQGPHETSIRAGEQRVLDWAPTIAKGAYTVRARLIYDLNRYNDRAFKDDQTELTKTSFEIAVTK
jgi:nitrate/TMAO reductase-like tetraheme cytochrome c subunit